MGLYGSALGIVFAIALGAAAFGIIASLVFHRIVGWYIEGAIGPIECIVIACLFLAIAGGIVIAPSILARVVLLTLLVVLVTALRLLGPHLERRETRKFYDERIEQYRQVIGADPLNLAARARLADALYKEGRLDEAIEELTEAVRLAPNSRVEASRLRQLIQEREERRDPPVTCPGCGHRNPKNKVYCMNCEADLRAISAFRARLADRGWKQLVRSSAVAVGVLMAVLMLGMLLPGLLRVVVVLVALLILVIWIVVGTCAR